MKGWLAVGLASERLSLVGHRYRAGAKFCAECGAALGQAQPLARTERKVVTVLFADLVGFTSRAEQLDPEDVRAVLSPFTGSCGPCWKGSAARWRSSSVMR